MSDAPDFEYPGDDWVHKGDIPSVCPICQKTFILYKKYERTVISQQGTRRGKPYTAHKRVYLHGWYKYLGYESSTILNPNNCRRRWGVAGRHDHPAPCCSLPCIEEQKEKLRIAEAERLEQRRIADEAQAILDKQAKEEQRVVALKKAEKALGESFFEALDGSKRIEKVVAVKQHANGFRVETVDGTVYAFPVGVYRFKTAAVEQGEYRRGTKRKSRFPSDRDL